MLTRFFQFPAAYTRTRSIKSLLLKNEDWQALKHASDLTSALNALLNTSYGECFDFSSVQSDVLPPMRSVEHILRKSYITAAKKILRFLHGAPKYFVVCFIQKYDLLNLKKTIRRLSQSAGVERGLKLKNYDLGRFSLLPNTDWDEIRDFKELGRLLENTYYQYAFRRGYAQFSEINDFLLFESFLEKAYYDELINKSKGLGISHFLGSFFDEICLSSFLRYRFEFSMDAPAILPLLPIEGCFFFTEQVFWKVAEAEDADEVFEIFKKTIRKNAEINGENMQEAVDNIKEARDEKCRKTFIKASPLSFSPILSYCFMKEREVSELIRLLQKKRFGLEM